MTNEVKASIETLEKIALRVLDDLASTAAWDCQYLHGFEEYHGFQKSRFPKDYVEFVTEDYGVSADDVQLELVLVDRDLANEVHVHNDSSAVIVILGPTHAYHDPVHGRVFLVDRGWFSVAEGDIFTIPKGTPHGFTVSPGKCFYFLSVQSPWILRKDERDDYVPAFQGE